MKCPECQSDVAESADHCFNCGYGIRTQQVLIRGSMVAGRFEILAPLGKGGMGMVYKARDHKLEEIVAIKVLRPEIAADPEMERRFRKEIRLARQVRHRNVCGIHEYGDDGSLRFITMEYIAGVDLRKLLVESGGLPLEEAFDTCILTAEGLQAIHEAGIVHRDLKTANLMRDSQGVVRLMDFGIAKEVNAEGVTATATGLVMGTPEYMSPEQAGAGKIDHRTDIYALGIVAFELFTGRVPFRGETALETIFMHLQKPPPLEGPGAEALPPSVVPILRKALAKDPLERFSTAAEFAIAIRQARDAAGVPPLVRRSSAPGSRAGATVTRVAAVTLPSPTREALPPPLAARSGPTVVPPTSGEPTLAPTVFRPPRVQEPSGAEAPPRKDEALPTTRRTGTVGLAAAVLLVIVAGVALLRHPSPPLTTPEPSPATTVSAAPSSMTVPAVAGPDGTLLIDAVPWGEVVEVVDAQGRHHEPGGARYTPLAMALPPGTYRVQVRNPGAAEPLVRMARVDSQALERMSVVFRRVSAQDYLQKTGY